MMQCGGVEMIQLSPYMTAGVPFCGICLKTASDARLERNRRPDLFGIICVEAMSPWLCGWCDSRWRAFERLRSTAHRANVFLCAVRDAPQHVQENVTWYWSEMCEIKREVFTAVTSSSDIASSHSLLKDEFEPTDIKSEESCSFEHKLEIHDTLMTTKTKTVVKNPKTAAKKPKTVWSSDDDSDESFSDRTPYCTQEVIGKKKKSGKSGITVEPCVPGKPRQMVPIDTVNQMKLISLEKGRESHKLKQGDTSITLDEKDSVIYVVRDVVSEYVGYVTLTEAERAAEHASVTRKAFFERAPHKCHHCALAYHSPQKYKAHMAQHSEAPKRMHHCVICNTYHRTQIRLDNHLLEHYRRFYCSVCTTTFTKYRDVIDHYFSAHGDVKFVCKYCSESFKRPWYLRLKHVERHVKKTSVECQECHKKVATENLLRLHMRLHTPKEVVWHECPTCGKKSKDKANMKQHMRIHEDNPPVQCHVCAKTCKSEKGLQLHIERHHIPGTSFQCDDCGKLFKVKADMTKHIRWVHMKTGGFHCQLCGKRLINRAMLRDHISFKHENKPKHRNKLCDVCGKGFNTVQQLSNHRLIHTGERPHTCPQCGQSFRQVTAMQTHIKLKHLHIRKKDLVAKRRDPGFVMPALPPMP